MSSIYSVRDYPKVPLPQVYAKFHGICFWCRSPVGDSYVRSLYLPKVLGGTNHFENVRLSHEICTNNRKDIITKRYQTFVTVTVSVQKRLFRTAVLRCYESPVVISPEELRKSVRTTYTYTRPELLKITLWQGRAPKGKGRWD
jgi:hypothetical protein